MSPFTMKKHTFLLGAIVLALLAAFASTSATTTEAGTRGVPPEAYDTLAATGSVDLILSVENADVLSQARGLIPSQGRGAAAARLEQLFDMRLTDALAALPADVEAERSFDRVGSISVNVKTAAALDALGRLPNFVRIDVSQELEPLLLESLALIHQPEAAAEGHTGEGTAIAVLDTGLDYTREAFGSCTAPGIPSSCRVAYAEDFTFFDDGELDAGTPKHGTNVGGIAAGAAPGADLLALDVFSGSLARDENIIQAINWVLNNAETYNIKAVNLSLGTPDEYPPEDALFGPCPTGLKSAFQALLAAGILPVVAAGNGGNDNELSYPGCISEAFSVGATYDESGVNAAFEQCTDSPSVVDTVACFSNSHGSMLDLLAPGARISAAGLNNWAGTSMAVPHVAAAAAVLGAIPGVDVDDVQSILKQTGPEITDPRNGVTKRRLDLLEAVTMATTIPTVELIAATTLDTNNNGRLDQLQLIFAENLNDEFEGLEIEVAGYTVESLTTGIAHDNIVLLNIHESDSGDSGATPQVTVIANDSLGTEEALVGPAGFTVTANDGAGPAIVAGQTTAKRRVHVEFSEAVDDATLIKRDIKLFIDGTRRGIKKLIKVDDDTWEIFVRRSAKWAPGATGTVKLKTANVINDPAGNGNGQKAHVEVAAGY